MFGIGLDLALSDPLWLDPGKLGIVDLIDGPYPFRILIMKNARLLFIRSIILF
jgi:hypothetical protein